MNKDWKLVVSLSLLVSAYLTTIYKVRGFRATTDEGLVAADIQRILHTGEISNLNYFSGTGYQTVSSIVLSVTGSPYNSLQYLSPLIATLAFAVFFVCGVLIIRRYDIPKELTLVSFALSIFIFGGFVSRIVESTHKKYTFVLVFLSLMVAHRLLTSDHDRRHYVPLFLLLAAISLYNYVWAAVYTATVGVGFILTRKWNAKAFVLATAVGFLGILAPRVNPATKYHYRYINMYKRAASRMTSLIYGLLPFGSNTRQESQKPTGGSSSPNSGPDTSPDPSNGTENVVPVHQSVPTYNTEYTGSTIDIILSQINEWPALSFLGFSVSVWYLYVAGIAALAGLSVLAVLGSVWLVWRHQDVAIAPQYLGITSVMGVFFVIFVVLGDVATLKRIIVLPGVFAVLVLPVFASRTSSLSAHRVAVVLVAITVLGAALAVPRTLPDGNSSPVDMYAEESELATADWTNQFGSSQPCYKVTENVLASTLNKRYSDSVKVFESGYADKIYSSGADSGLFYQCGSS